MDDSFDHKANRNGVFITLGYKAAFGVQDSGHPDCGPDLVVEVPDYATKQNTCTKYNLGKATKKRITELQGFLEQVKLHCEDE